MMQVSAILAVHNGQRYLVEAIDSVLRQPEVEELIVIDDGSTDATAEVLDRYGSSIRRAHQLQAGQPTALNLGMRLATHDVIAFQDADDVWPAGRLTQLLEPLTDPTIGGAFGICEQFISPELPPELVANVRVVQTPRPAALLANTVIRRDVALAVGPLDSTLRTAAGLDWIARARALGVVMAEVESVTLRRRIHDANLGRRVGSAQRNTDLLTILRSHLARGRSDPAASAS